MASKQFSLIAVTPIAPRETRAPTELERGKSELDALLETVALISHDLRGPLEAIVFSAKVLRRSLEQHGLADEIRTVDRVAANAERMNSMIAELLEAARPEAGSVSKPRVPCDLGELVVSVVERLDDASQARIAVDAEVPPYALVGDPERLERAIANLLTNALKYSADERKVRVLLTRGESEVAVEVIDRGIGIAKENLPRLFDRFFRVATEKRDGGLGLGLYIARLAAEAHGGRIVCTSEVGRGSSFRMILPTTGRA